MNWVSLSLVVNCREKRMKSDKKVENVDRQRGVNYRERRRNRRVDDHREEEEAEADGRRRRRRRRRRRIAIP